MHRYVLLSIDLLLVAASTMSALVLRDNLEISSVRMLSVLPYLLLTLLAAVPVLLLAGLNRTLWRFSSFNDITRVSVGVVATVLLAMANQQERDAMEEAARERDEALTLLARADHPRDETRAPQVAIERDGARTGRAESERDLARRQKEQADRQRDAERKEKERAVRERNEARKETELAVREKKQALALHERGLFKWPEWAAALAAEIKRAQAAGDPDTGETYYRHWLNALERVVAEKGVTDTATLARYRHAWDHAADRTPHGEPIELQPSDFHHHG